MSKHTNSQKDTRRLLYHKKIKSYQDRDTMNKMPAFKAFY